MSPMADETLAFSATSAALAEEKSIADFSDGETFFDSSDHEFTHEDRLKRLTSGENELRLVHDDISNAKTAAVEHQEAVRRLEVSIKDLEAWSKLAIEDLDARIGVLGKKVKDAEEHATADVKELGSVVHSYGRSTAAAIGLAASVTAGMLILHLAKQR
ncbi:hypothetical protein OPV22_018935 [Ensete ventricosum]|uniref:DUF883 domain-containing protein n=1 Tax=Ensete ventricosum TaxID=4639 RepID=A0AAV8R333_ENSVE|nr:hypothetical protein OPV22_018935 [Ensete ventricosum]